ncbi:DEAD/DEAH box helicase family protein [Microbacterium sp. ZW T2_14]|uniref:DEAD/DEAH box helicase family protein n=1 Tax=Microbacterium sp. ZW T2_14 TaxID=3378079 RepID=UPI0038546D46
MATAKSLADLFPEKPVGEPRLYAWSSEEVAERWRGCLKIGQTTRDVNARIRESQGQARVEYVLQVDEPAIDADGIRITDTAVRERLIAKGFSNIVFQSSKEWVRCTADDVLTAITELREHRELTGTHHETFEMRDEQKAAVEATLRFFQREWDQDEKAVPRFLWNAKMRFGKTFSSYQLAKKMGARRVLVVTFKPAVADAWETDLNSHADFDGWVYASKDSGPSDPLKVDSSKPLVYFGSFQDLLGREKGTGLIKAKNEWIHIINWDLVIFDEYHFGAWRENAKELFEGEDEKEARAEQAVEFSADLAVLDEELDEQGNDEADFLPITTRAFLYLSGTPFRALAEGEFVDDNLFNWTYTDEQKAKTEWPAIHPGKPNPYATLPEMALMTYRMPEDILTVAMAGEFDEFDLNEFFAATGVGSSAEFRHKSDVQNWLNLIRGQHQPTSVDALRAGTRPPFPYSDTHVLPYLNHSFWFLPTVASVNAMENLLGEAQNTNGFWGDYTVINAAGPGAGIGLAALPPVRAKIRDGFKTKTITLSCGKLTTGVTVPQWSAILMLRNLQRPETYFQAAFRVQSPWAISNPNGDDPKELEVVKPVCFVFDFAPTRALRQVADYARGLNPNETNDDKAVADLLAFLPVLAYDGSNMVPIDAGSVLDIAQSGTSATLLARKWESALLVNVDNDTLRKVLANPNALQAIQNIEGFRSLGDNVFETIINKSEKIKDLKKTAKERDLTPKEKQELTEEEKQQKSLRKQVQEKLIKFATRIPAFMYLTDFRENALVDVIKALEPDLFRTVTGLTIPDFDLLRGLGLFNSSHMNDAVKTFRRFEDASLSYAGVDSHEGLRHWGLFDTVIEAEVQTH